MATRDIVTIGASAGGVEALLGLVRDLPADLPAALFVVVHSPPYARSQLPKLLQRVGTLPATHADDAEPIQPGTIRVAPPGLHLLVKRDHIRLLHGPSENGHRPAIDPLFRSAAAAYGPRTVAVALSGVLDDGSAGAAAVQAAGGVILTQEVAEAAYPDLPAHVRERADRAEELRVADIANRLVELSATPVEAPAQPQPATDPLERSLSLPASDRDVAVGAVCPSCGGPMRQDDGEETFRCHVGHAWSAENLAAAQDGQFEGALWSAVRLLEERSMLAQRLRERAHRRGMDRAADRYERQIAETEGHARQLRDLILARASHPAVDPSTS